LETAKSLVRKNIRAFENFGVDQILVPCGSCFYFLKEGYLKLFPLDQEVEAFSKKIVEPSGFFLNLISPKGANDASQSLNPKGRITYHDPCHLRRAMKIYQEPRKLLKSLRGVELVEMKQPDRCCGMAGSFNLVYYGLSRKILAHKVDDIEATKADYVVTSCMGCIIQLKDGVYQRKMATKVVHLIEFFEKRFNQ
jgi:glycolate oxidase iron-sulfur subunit